MRLLTVLAASFAIGSASAGFVETGNCTSSSSFRALSAKCEYQCPIDLRPYHECHMDTNEFHCTCIAPSKAECFIACYGAGKNGEHVAATFPQLSACKNKCDIRGEDASVTVVPDVKKPEKNTTGITTSPNVTKTESVKNSNNNNNNDGNHADFVGVSGAAFSVFLASLFALTF